MPPVPHRWTDLLLCSNDGWTFTGEKMNLKNIIFAIIGAVVALFYALESFLYFSSEGINGPLFIKILICLIGVMVFWKNVRPKGAEASAPDQT